VFTHDASGEVRTVDVKPGRFVSWPNNDWTHELKRGTVGTARHLLGPMTLSDGAMKLVSVGKGSSVDFVAQSAAKPLTVSPGSKFKITTQIIVTDWNSEENLPVAVGACLLNHWSTVHT
jgi:hypothetical protein